MTGLTSSRRPRACRAALSIACAVATVLVVIRPARAEVTVGRLSHLPIVIAADAAPAEKHAADELRDIVARATGTRPEIVIGRWTA